MAIRKQEFYEGAALYMLARAGQIAGVLYDAPFFVINGAHSVLIKYSTRARSPWGFTFTPSEQHQLRERSIQSELLIGLVCGGDGVACLPYCDYEKIAADRSAAVHVACYRRHGEHYEVLGPDGALPRKVAPSAWPRLLAERVEYETH